MTQQPSLVATLPSDTCYGIPSPELSKKTIQLAPHRLRRCTSDQLKKGSPSRLDANDYSQDTRSEWTCNPVTRRLASDRLDGAAGFGDAGRTFEQANKFMVCLGEELVQADAAKWSRDSSTGESPVLMGG
jgi:hypothetical protein